MDKYDKILREGRLEVWLVTHENKTQFEYTFRGEKWITPKQIEYDKILTEYKKLINI